jgi:hypothetical protein
LAKVDRAGRWDAFLVRKRTGWNRGLEVEASGKGPVGHAEAVLQRAANHGGLVVRLREAMRAGPWMLDRANVLAGLVVGIALGARNLRQAELPARHHGGLVGDGASDSMLWRMLGEIDDRARVRIAKPRADVRARVWGLPAHRDTGFPWLVILGRELVGWSVIDLDATAITCSSRKERAIGTYIRVRGGFILSRRGARTRSSAWPRCSDLGMRARTPSPSTSPSLDTRSRRSRAATGARSLSAPTAPAPARPTG